MRDRVDDKVARREKQLQNIAIAIEFSLIEADMRLIAENNERPCHGSGEQRKSV
jgi:hypothetical protein